MLVKTQAKTLRHQGDQDHAEGEEEDQVAPGERGPALDHEGDGERGGQRDSSPHARVADDGDLMPGEVGVVALARGPAEVLGEVSRRERLQEARPDHRQAHERGVQEHRRRVFATRIIHERSVGFPFRSHEDR